MNASGLSGTAATLSDLMGTLCQSRPESSPLRPVLARPREVGLFVSLFEGLFALFCGLASLHCTPHSPLHLCELVETVTSCLLLTANSPCFGSGPNLIHNWKWLLRSIWYAFVLLTSAARAPPGAAALGGFSFLFLCPWCHFNPPLPSISLSVSLLWCTHSTVIHTSLAIALNFNFSQNVLLSSCLYLDAICLLFLPRPFPPSRRNVFFHVGAFAYIIWLCFPQSEINHCL